ncbi:MAG: HAD family hydrolase [Alicyclobacillus sp.]|nr:HAD family hydrolase [Alicyclobacillus sp.]
MTLNTLMFDLDGTLLPMDLDEFMKGYFGALVPKVRHVIRPDSFLRHLWDSTVDMMRNEDETLTNLEAFKQSFLSATGLREGDIWPLFDKFYAEEFGELQRWTQPSAISREICRTAADKGYRLVLATNPIFPAEAVYHRMRWAGIDDLPFALVTTMEHMHYCKPNPKYYAEILDRLGADPSECMMFGNDVQEDGAARQAGVRTFLVTDCLIDHGSGNDLGEFDYIGSLQDVLVFVRSLPALASASASGTAALRPHPGG